jgi:hypothetical protein
MREPGSFSEVIFNMVWDLRKSGYAESILEGYRRKLRKGMSAMHHLLFGIIVVPPSRARHVFLKAYSTRKMVEPIDSNCLNAGRSIWLCDWLKQDVLSSKV